MALSKLEKFEELRNFENVVEAPKRKDGEAFLSKDLEEIRKKLNEFIDTDELVLELGCGKGVYTIELAKKFPNKKFIGVDIQGERLWVGAKHALEEGLPNVLFFRSYVDHLSDFFPENSISEIWITFPDPFPRRKQSKKRLTSSKFLEIYKNILKPSGIIHFKTDDETLFEYSVEILSDSGFKIVGKVRDVHSVDHGYELLEIKTDFEKKHIKNGKKIYYLKAQVL